VKTVYKYPLEIADEVFINMPYGARILYAGAQTGSGYVWALVDTDAEMAPVMFCIRGTGHDCQDVLDMKYVGTFMLLSGALVFHVFMGTGEDGEG
jgi:hypothetical protein